MSNEQPPQQLTVKEAIEQGYTHWGYDSGEFQRLGRLEDFSNSDFKDAINYGYGDCVLAEKQPWYLNISAGDMRDMISDHVMAQDNYKDDDYNIIPDALKEVEGWDAFAAKINAKLREHPYWNLTHIKLLP